MIRQTEIPASRASNGFMCTSFLPATCGFHYREDNSSANCGAHLPLWAKQITARAERPRSARRASAMSKKTVVVQVKKTKCDIDPRAEFLAYGKRRLNAAVRAGHVSESTKAKMRLAAVKHPGLFGAWASV